MLHVILLRATENDKIIPVSCSKVMFILDERVHHLLKCRWYSTKPKWHDCKLKLAEGGNKSSFMARSFGHWYLPVSWSEIKS